MDFKIDFITFDKFFPMRLSYPFVICWITFLLAFSSTKAQSYFRIKQQVIQYWSGTWENYERLTFSYDSAGNLSGKIKDVFTLNTSSGSWNLYSRENTLFDSLHRPVQATTQLYSNSN